jgi:hypothetical protein
MIRGLPKLSKQPYTAAAIMQRRMSIIRTRIVGLQAMDSIYPVEQGQEDEHNYYHRNG